MCDDFFDDFEDIDPDYIDGDEYENEEDCFEESEDSEADSDKDVEPKKEEYLGFDDPFWLGVAAGFGYELGQEERRKKKRKK